jgi:hypothetical protein
VTSTQVPATLHAALTKPSGEHPSVVVQDEPLGVRPHTIAHAAGIQLAPPLTGTFAGAPAHVLAAAMCTKYGAAQPLCSVSFGAD